MGDLGCSSYPSIMCKKEQAVSLNTKLAIRILMKLNNTPNWATAVCAKDFEIPHDLFGQQLDIMADSHLISPPVPRIQGRLQIPMTFLTKIADGNTQIQIMMTDAGKQYLTQHGGGTVK